MSYVRFDMDVRKRKNLTVQKSNLGREAEMPSTVHYVRTALF